VRRGHSESHEPSPVGFDRQVHQVVTMLLKGGPPDVQLVASTVRTSTRTLQRRLRRAGLTYGGVLQEVRCRVAAQMLTNPARKISDVARALGYSDPSHFARAFQRWTGLTPTDFRRRGRVRDDRVARGDRPRTEGFGQRTLRA
jgi:AraC-like DNA-binding protein